MVKDKSLNDRMLDYTNVLLLTLVGLVTLYPMIHVVMSSFSDGRRILEHTGFLFSPLGFDLAAYLSLIHI